MFLNGIVNIVEVISPPTDVILLLCYTRSFHCSPFYKYNLIELSKIERTLSIYGPGTHKKSIETDLSHRVTVSSARRAQSGNSHPSNWPRKLI